MAHAGETRIKDLFGEALERSGADRTAFLDAACAGNSELRQRIESLLAAAEREDKFLRADPVDMEAMARKLQTEGPGSRLGPYTLLELLGEGGFGEVYIADQSQPVQRRVAVKIIKLGMDTKAVVARFEQERQALAVMDHPNIAKVLDAGVSKSGRPYFVMEYVDGIPITTYCDRYKLSIPERLRLFEQVCRAIQHAHTKGLIHRDIKPTNVLVSKRDDGPLARVIDFGIAKATQRSAAEKRAFTEESQLIGTPEYMSPEQAGGSGDIDTRSDVYSLGVLLYELLTGATPFDPRTLRSAAYAEIQRIIREVEPPKPSTRLAKATDTRASAAATRSIEPARLESTLRGELDWIVMKALEKDRARRYDSPGELANELERFLTGKAVAAAPPSKVYQARKFVRRNRALFASSVAVLAALVVGLAVATLGFVRASQQRDRAVAAEADAQKRFEEAEAARKETDKFNRIATRVADFFTLDILDVRPLRPGEKEPTVSELLERVPSKIERYFKEEPAADGIIRGRVGQIYQNMGKPLLAQPYLEAAPALLEKGLGPDAGRTLAANRRLASLYDELGMPERAEPLYSKVYETRLRVDGEKYLFTWTSLADRGNARVRMGRVAEGFTDMDTAIEKLREMGYEASRARLLTMQSRAEAYITAGDPRIAERRAREGIDETLASVPELHHAQWGFRETLANALLAQGRGAEGLPEVEAAIEAEKKEYARDHPKQLALRQTRARILAEVGRAAEARSELEDVYARTVIHRGERNPWSRQIAGNIAAICEKQGDAAGAATWNARK